MVNNQQTCALLILLKHSREMLSGLIWWDTIIQEVRDMNISDLNEADLWLYSVGSDIM